MSSVSVSTVPSARTSVGTRPTGLCGSSTEAGSRSVASRASIPLIPRFAMAIRTIRA